MHEHEHESTVTTGRAAVRRGTPQAGRPPRNAAPPAGQALTPGAALYIQRAGGNRAFGQVLAEAGRIKRISARALNNKSTPNVVYRLDRRPPEVIARDGFAPWSPEGTISLREHVTGALDRADENGSTLAKNHSQWVSTGAPHMLKDPTLLTVGNDKYLYRIDTSHIPGGFTDANDHFDRAKVPRPYAKQREWTHEGTIPAAAVTGHLNFMQEVVGQLIIDPSPGAARPVTVPEGGIQGWHAMPTPALGDTPG